LEPTKVVTNPATIAELNNGQFPGKEEALKPFSTLPLLSLNDDVTDIVTAYLARKIMPKTPEETRCIWQLLPFTGATSL